MKTFSQFQEDVDSMKATMKGFADTIVPKNILLEGEWVACLCSLSMGVMKML